MTLSDFQGHAPVASLLMQFFVQLCSSKQNFSWHSASRGPSATDELLVVCGASGMSRECFTGTSCDDAFQLGSSCYKVHKEHVNRIEAFNRCLSNNATLAVFDDDVRNYFPSSLITPQAWIGLLKSWWTWPALSKLTKKNFTIANKLCVSGSSQKLHRCTKSRNLKQFAIDIITYFAYVTVCWLQHL